MHTPLKHTVFFILLFSFYHANAQQQTMVSRPKITLYSEIHAKDACKQQTKDIVEQGNTQEHYVGLENVYDKKYIDWYLKNVLELNVELQANHTLYALENNLLYSFSFTFGNIQNLETTIRRRMQEANKKRNGQTYDAQRIKFLGDRLSLNFNSLEENYQHNTLYKIAFGWYLGINISRSSPKGSLRQAIQAKFPNIIGFIDALNEGFVWDRIRTPGPENLVSAFIQSTHDNLPQALQNNSVIFDEATRNKAIDIANQYQDQKETDNYFVRSQPEYWMYIIFWRNQSFISPIKQMIDDWENDPLQKNKEIKIILGADHAQDLKERILKQFAISATINEDCL